MLAEFGGLGREIGFEYSVFPESWSLGGKEDQQLSFYSHFSGFKMLVSCISWHGDYRIAFGYT